MKHLAKIFILLILSTLLASCGGADASPLPGAAVAPSQQSLAGTNARNTGSIAETAQQQGFNALLAAAAKANLGAALSDANSSMTVFAPTDAAFNQLAAKLGFADAGALVSALPASALQSILLYHVLPTAKTTSALMAQDAPQETLYRFEGQPASLALDNSTDGLSITDAALVPAHVTSADIMPTNGVIHVIDKVLIPPGVLNIVQMAQVNPDLSMLANAVTATGLQDALSAAGPFTVFAPTNAAFAQAPSGLSMTQLTTVLKYHVLASEVRAAQIPFGTPVPTLAQQTIQFNRVDAAPGVTITDATGATARIVATDVHASNGVIHVIDKVLIPAL